MFHVKLITQNRTVKRIGSILLIVFLFSSCVTINPNPKITDYHLINATSSKELEKEVPAVFMFENNRMKQSFQNFLGQKFNVKNENRNFEVRIQNESFVISVLDKIETEKVITFQDFIFKNPDRAIIKSGDQQAYVAISVTDKIGNDCLKNNSIYQNLILNYLKELKLEYSKL